jgi:hypothetical protein
VELHHLARRSELRGSTAPPLLGKVELLLRPSSTESIIPAQIVVGRTKSTKRHKIKNGLNQKIFLPSVNRVPDAGMSFPKGLRMIRPLPDFANCGAWNQMPCSRKRREAHADHPSSGRIL